MHLTTTPAVQRRWGLTAAVLATVVTTASLSWLAIAKHHGGDQVVSKDVAVSTLALPTTMTSNGPSDVEAFTLRLRPGASVPWHEHAGYILAAVTEGTMTMYDADGTSCTRSTYGPGESVVERPGMLHTTKNEGRRDLVYLVFSMHPKGSDLSTRLPRPADCHH
jgi:quercetin dioxygenase-like cupin family protein